MDLAPGEHEIYEGHPSWRSILGFHTTGLIVALVAGAIGFVAASAGVGIAIFAAIFLITVIIGFLRRIGTSYRITNRRLYIKRGIIARKTQEANLQRVQNVNTTQSAFQRVLQIGTVDFDTAGSSDADFAFQGVAQPEKVVRAVDAAQREFQEEQMRAPAAGLPQQQQGL
jgi:uncharacterized membrane protein YdbT with pleckstrin-like domain